MGKYLITPGDFLKNAGISGMEYMLKMSGARENIDYGIKEQGTVLEDIAEYEYGLWLDVDYAMQADWTGLFFGACVEYYESSTVYRGVLDRIEAILHKIIAGEWKADSNDRDNLKYINDKLLSNSYKSGFDNIRDRVDSAETYIILQKNKLNSRMEEGELKERLEELRTFLNQPICRETFVMKSVVYNYINRFWDGKCFLLRANAKKDMRELFDQDFVKPFKEYIAASHDKDKDMCIDCARPMGNKEKVSIAFMKDMADDLARKKSAFWNCKVDAFLCPACAFVYALSPLGFTLLGNRFAFINTNDSIKGLLIANDKERRNETESDKSEDERYTQWFARMLKRLLDCKLKELSGVQVIIRGTQADDKYNFAVISTDALRIFREKRVQSALEYFGRHPYVKIGAEYINIHESVIMNVIKYKSQTALLDKILKTTFDNPGCISSAFWVYMVMLWSNIVTGNKENGGNVEMNRVAVMNSGFALRAALLAEKGAKDDECLRGTLYQLMNALSTKNAGRFLDIVMRLYSTCKVSSNAEQAGRLMIPSYFVRIINSQDAFEEYGYAFVLGLKGCNMNKKNNDNKEENKEEA